MTSNAPDVQTYCEGVPIERRAAIDKLRALCRRTLKGYEECMAYGMPAYRRNDVIEVGFASQKQYIALYVLKKEVVDEFRTTLAASSIGKGCIRFTRPEKIDFAILKQLLQRNADSKSVSC